MIHFIYSNDFVSRKNIFETDQIFSSKTLNIFYPRYDTSESNINLLKKPFSMENERIQFPKRKQKEFIKYTKDKSFFTWREFAKVLDFNYNNLQNLWKENYRISKSDFERICLFINKEPNLVINKFNGKKIVWNNLIALSKIKKKRIFGKPQKKQNKINLKYKNKCLSLNLIKIRINQQKNKLKISLPNKISNELAYETGTSIGDGCIPTRRKSYRLKGNKNDEKEYYKLVIKPLFKKLYGIDIILREYQKAFGFEIYSKTLIDFKNKVLRLPIGSKNKIKIPNIFKINNKEILCALISGIFDTDGSLSFKSQGKNKNYYPTLRITTISLALAKDIEEILKMLGFNVYIFKNNNICPRKPNPTFDVIFDGYDNFSNFVKLIGTKQRKNIDKINNWRKEWPNISG